MIVNECGVTPLKWGYEILETLVGFLLVVTEFCGEKGRCNRISEEANAVACSVHIVTIRHRLNCYPCWWREVHAEEWISDVCTRHESRKKPSSVIYVMTDLHRIKCDAFGNISALLPRKWRNKIWSNRSAPKQPATMARLWIMNLETDNEIHQNGLDKTSGHKEYWSGYEKNESKRWTILFMKG